VRIIITGGAGCLGSNLIEHYVPAGHEVLAIDNFATGKREVLPQVSGLTVIEGSIADNNLITQCFDDFEPTHVIHSAAAYKDPADWHEDTATNIIGTINVAQAAARHGVARFVNFQTALCYGIPRQVPIPVTHPTEPFTSYGISKTAGERYLMASSLPIVSLRLANITGPRLAIGPIPTFYKRLKAGQNCFCSDTVRDFLDIADFLSVMDIVMDDGAPDGVYNVSTGDGRSIKDVFDVVTAHLGIELTKPVPIVPPGEDDVPSVVLDPKETQRALRWEARFDFVDTIRRQLIWYDKHGVSDIHSHLSKPQA
tara:strand:+ start:3473 stop:4405 length:933 start_codon:yes stop_codon:yes gene_type:complete